MLDTFIEKFQEGLIGAILEIGVGLITPIIISAFINGGIVPSDFIWIFYFLSGIISVFVIVKLLEEMSFWGISYIIGWLVGVFLLIDSGLLTHWDFVFYLIAPLVFFGYKLGKWILDRKGIF